MLHVHNGSLAGGVVESTGLTGEHLVWREDLVAGPTPYGLSPDEWRDVRTRFLAEAYNLDLQECRRQALEQEELLKTFSRHEEVVLWFESDLFCQTMLLFLLDWFATRDLSRTRLSMVNVSRFPDLMTVKGICRMYQDQIMPLFEQREEVTDKVFGSATTAWRAYRSPDPEAIQDAINDDNSALPFLADSLRAHLARFPSVRNGLGRVENKALELINKGNTDFISLYSEYEDEDPIYGFGNLHFFNELRRVANVHDPLLVIRDVDEVQIEDSAGPIIKASVEITDTGRLILTGEQHFIDLNGIDLWLGGVHLKNNGPGWRWDEQNRALQRVT